MSTGRGRRRRWLAHLEAQTHWRGNLPKRVGRYQAILVLGQDIATYSVLILLAKRFAPKRIPSQYYLAKGGTEIKVRYRVIKLWEMNPKRILASGRSTLMPWISLMRSSDSQVEEAIRAVKTTRDPQLVAQSLLLGGLRYDTVENETWDRLKNMLLSEEIIKESRFYKMVRAEGLREGVRKGRRAGELAGRRKVIRQIVATRFPSLGDLPQLDRISDAQKLETLVKKLLLTKTSAAARRAIADILT